MGDGETQEGMCILIQAYVHHRRGRRSLLRSCSVHCQRPYAVASCLPRVDWVYICVCVSVCVMQEDARLRAEAARRAAELDRKRQEEEARLEARRAFIRERISKQVCV